MLSPDTAVLQLLLLLLFVRAMLFGSQDVTAHRTGYRQRTVTPRSVVRNRTKPSWVSKEVIRLAAHMPEAGRRRIALTFNRLYIQAATMTVGKTFVANALRRHHAEIAMLRSRWKRAIPDSLPNNTLWAMDLTGRMDERGRQHSIVTIVDHGSRKALALQTLPTRSSITALRVLLDCIEQFGKQRALRTDKDLAFTSRWFTLALRVLAIRHQRSALHIADGRTAASNACLARSKSGWVSS